MLLYQLSLLTSICHNDILIPRLQYQWSHVENQLRKFAMSDLICDAYKAFVSLVSFMYINCLSQ